MDDYKKQLEEWTKKAHKKVRGQRVDRAKEERLKKEAEWKKRANDPKRPKLKGPGYKKEWDLTDNWDPQAIK